MHKYEYLLFVHIKYAEKLCDSNSEINRSNALREILKRSCQLMFESIIKVYMVMATRGSELYNIIFKLSSKHNQFYLDYSAADCII